MGNTEFKEMATEYADRDFLEFIVKSIVDHPEDVKVERKIDEMGVLLTLKVNPQDMGQVIGRKGSTSTAIRSLLRIVGIKNNARVNLKIEEPEGGQREERRSFREEKGEPEMGAIDKVIDDIKDL